MTTRMLMLGAALLGFGTPAVAGTKIQMNIVPTIPDCYVGPNFCKNDGSACVVDADCTATMSAASKFKIDGVKLLLKGGAKKVIDQALTLVTTDPTDPNDDYILRLSLCHCVLDALPPQDVCNNCNTAYIRFDLKNGNGKIEGDLNGIFPTDAAGTGMQAERAAITRMSNPAGCTGDNSAGAIAARLDDVDCETGLYLGIGGFRRLQ